MYSGCYCILVLCVALLSRRREKLTFHFGHISGKFFGNSCPFRLFPPAVAPLPVRMTGSRLLPGLRVIEISQQCGQGGVLSFFLVGGFLGFCCLRGACSVSVLTHVLPLRGGQQLTKGFMVKKNKTKHDGVSKISETALHGVVSHGGRDT